MTFIIFIDYTDDKVDESGESGMSFKSHGKVARSRVFCSERMASYWCIGMVLAEETMLKTWRVFSCFGKKVDLACFLCL